jgi:hypothetical protein
MNEEPLESLRITQHHYEMDLELLYKKTNSIVQRKCLKGVDGDKVHFVWTTNYIEETNSLCILVIFEETFPEHSKEYYRFPIERARRWWEMLVAEEGYVMESVKRFIRRGDIL